MPDQEENGAGMLPIWPNRGGFCMPGLVEHVRNQAASNPRLQPAIDQLLIAGIKLGPNKKHEAINKILKLVREGKRGDCWRRIGQLRRTPAPTTVGTAPDLRKPATNGSAHRPVSRPWLPEDDHKLLDWAGYEPVDKNLWIPLLPTDLLKIFVRSKETKSTWPSSIPRWLMGEYGVSETANGETVLRAQKHALVIRK
jgi:hypothetical protein